MLLESYLGNIQTFKLFTIYWIGHLLRNGVSLLILHSHYDSLLHLTQDGHQDSVSKLAVVTVGLLVVFPGVDMDHPVIRSYYNRTIPPLSLLTYFGGLPSAMAFLPRAELSTTFILVVFITPQVCQI